MRRHDVLHRGPGTRGCCGHGSAPSEIARIKNLMDPKVREFVWIAEFPMFEYSETEGRYMAVHHPFHGSDARTPSDDARRQPQGLQRSGVRPCA